MDFPSIKPLIMISPDPPKISERISINRMPFLIKILWMDPVFINGSLFDQFSVGSPEFSLIPECS